MSVLIAMSGGVDSSVSAYLMREKYKSCMGATMILHGGENVSDARSVCDVLGIEHELIDCMSEFRERVISHFVSVYESGGTPNPCIDCNKFMKFGLMLEHAERTATGHYARIEQSNSGRWLLRKGVDISRDQSYVLYMMSQEQLSRVEFPLGGMLKSDVRDLAGTLGFTNARKHDSQDICFVPDGNYAGFIEEYTGKTYPPGKFIDTDGKILGTHKGIIHYTTGQRRGLGVAAKSRLYVSGINPNDNTITLAAENEAGLYARGVVAENVNVIAYDTLPENFSGRVKIRYRQKEIPAVINQTGDNELVIEFAEKQKAPARGQAAVIYDGDYVVGGGTIAGVL